MKNTSSPAQAMRQLHTFRICAQSGPQNAAALGAATGSRRKNHAAKNMHSNGAIATALVNPNARLALPLPQKGDAA